MDTSSLVDLFHHGLRHLDSRSIAQWRLSTVYRIDSDAAIGRSLLRLLAVAHNEQLDTAALVSNFADEHRGLWKYRLHRLAKRIESGTPLVNALEQTPNVLTPSQTLAVRFATQSGTLTEAYKHLTERPIAEELTARATYRRAWYYTAAMIAVLVLVITFLNVRIVPFLVAIHHEFSIPEMPWSLRTFIDVNREISKFAVLWLAIAIGAMCLVLLSPLRRRIASWVSPWWTRVSTQSHSAELLRMLAIAGAAGRPLAGSLSLLARHHFDREVRSRLLFARNEVEQGAEPWECLQRARFLTPAEADAIRSASDNRLQAWTLRQIAQTKATAVANRHARLAAFARPAITLLLAIVVLWIAAAFIQQLASLIQYLA